MCRHGNRCDSAPELHSEDEDEQSSPAGVCRMCCGAPKQTPRGKPGKANVAQQQLRATGILTEDQQRCIAYVAIAILVLAVLCFAVVRGRGILKLLDQFQRWLRHQSHQRLLLLLWLLLPLDVLPIGHAMAKPVQIAIALVFDAVSATITLCVYVFLHTMVCYIIGRHCLRACVVQYVLEPKGGGSAAGGGSGRAVSKEAASGSAHADWRDWARALDRLCADGSPAALRLVILFRLVPLPELMGSYALSVTRISLSHYMLTACVEAVKSAAMSQYVALNIRAGTRAALHPGRVDWLTIGLLVSGILMLVLLLRALHTAVKREFQSAESATLVVHSQA